MPTTRKNKLEATAYHEAGHAVVAWSFGVRVKSVSILRDEDSLGRIVHEKIFRRNDSELDDSPRVRDRFETLVMICLAGLEAQRMYRPRSVRRYHASSDHQTAIECAFHLGGSAKAANLYLKLLLIWTRARIRNFWPEVQVLAERLIERGSISGEEARQIMIEARGIPGLRMGGTGSEVAR